MTLYTDDPDATARWTVTDTSGNDNDFDPTVACPAGDVDASWEGEPAVTRVLRVSVTGLPAGVNHPLRLIVPGGNDVDLGVVLLQ